MHRRVVIGRCAQDCEFGFDVGGSALRGRVGEHNLAVDAYDGETAGTPSSTACPRRTRYGWVCGDCEPKDRSFFETREYLWRDHLFEPLLAWIDETLAPVDALALFGSAENIFHAQPVAGAEATTGATKVLPLIATTADW